MKKTLISCALALIAGNAFSQVEDISVTVSPTASYQWWDNNAAIEDGVFIGGRVGFGFGEYLELRGVYEQTLDLKNTFGEFENEYEDLEFKERDVDVKRYGGELKANLPTGGGFAPYITLGSGIQEVEVKENLGDYKNKQIYATAGLGAKVNFGDRATFNIEVKNHAFNMNPASVLFVPADESDFEDAIGATKDTRMYNWSALAGLQFYLGGREPGSLSDLDREYMRKFSGGLTGFKLVLEPGGAYINWDKDVDLKDTYLLGGSAGIDLNQFVGLRGFYYQSTKDEKISTDWDELAMYGGDIYAKLNVARGLVPYITIGGGYLNVYDSYESEGATMTADDMSGYFAKGGVGVTIPVADNFEVFGAANMMYTTGKDPENVSNPDDLRNHTMYNAGIRLQLGGVANTEEKVKERTSKRFDKQEMLYQERIKELEEDLQRAYNNNDTDEAVRIIEEKRRLEDKNYNDRKRYSDSSESRVVMSPNELQDLVNEVLSEVEIDENSKEDSNNKESQDKEDLKKRIERLENLLMQVNEQNRYSAPSYSQNQAVPASETEKILAELRRLNDKIDRNAMQLSNIDNDSASDKTIIVGKTGETQTVTEDGVVTTNTVATTPENTIVDSDNDGEADGVAKGIVAYQGMSVFGGASFSKDDTYGVFGVRGHYNFTGSNFKFVPDIYVGLGDDTGFGINANAQLDVAANASEYVRPYIGAGIGINKIEGDSKFNTNIIIGTALNVLDGNLYVDYTARNLFDGNQVAVGYRFSF